MTTAGLTELRLAYKKAVDEWVWAIRAEEDLATTDHSMTEMERERYVNRILRKMVVA